MDGLKLLASGGVPKEVKEKSVALVRLVPAQKKRALSREIGDDSEHKPSGIQKVSCFFLKYCTQCQNWEEDRMKGS